MNLLAALATNECLNVQTCIDQVITDTSFVETILKESGPLSEAAINCASQIFSSPIQARKHLLFTTMDSFTNAHPVDAIASKALSLIESTKEQAYLLLSSMIANSFILQEAVVQSQLVSFLLNREADRSLFALHSKYRLIQMLVERPEINEQLREQFTLYLRQGPVYAPRAPLLATERRN